MNVDNLLRLANNFFYTHTYIVIAVAAALIIITCLWPKQTLKFILILLAVIVAANVIYYLGQAIMTGVSGKERMLYK